MSDPNTIPAPAVLSPLVPQQNIVDVVKKDIVTSEAFLTKILNWMKVNQHKVTLILGIIIGFILGHLI